MGKSPREPLWGVSRQIGEEGSEEGGSEEGGSEERDGEDDGDDT